MSQASHADLANAIRALSMDAVQQANSGHPGMPMGMADVATVLFTKFLSFDAAAPDWPDRDRFVLSAGHGSMLLYSLLHLTGYKDMSMAQLKNFRQLGSKTAGHPEYGHAKGIETTTGPLGQGIANAVGMAIAESHLAARFGKSVVDHYTYVIAGDGCLMEGISHEAISLAGHLGLSKLIVLFDDNSVSIDGPTDLAVSDDQIARFKACGWATDKVDGHDPAAIEKAIAAAKKNDQPTMIACKTVIGFGAPTKAGTSATHGAPLGPDEIAGAREKLGWPHKPFTVPKPVLNAWRKAGSRGAKSRKAWDKRVAKLKPDARADFKRAISGGLPKNWQDAITGFKRQMSKDAPKVATRAASQKVLEVLNDAVPELVGGSADLTGSNNTKTSQLGVLNKKNPGGRYIYYGVREHGMAAAMNGMALHGGVIPYGGTFLIFTDYCRPSIRLSALMNQRVIYVMTHDSIGLGEDGPTHQPVEQLSALRAIPNLTVFRPCDIVETAEAWELAVDRTDGPSVIALTRQGLPTVRTRHSARNQSAKGGYVLSDTPTGKRDVTLIATGSEVEIALDAQAALAKKKIGAAVVSMPCLDLFDSQTPAYRNKVLGDAPRVAVEAAVQQSWDHIIGPSGRFVGMTGFGASGPIDALYKHFGITADAVVKQATDAIRATKPRKSK
ncbi:MAG: transketolase [Alphaproteobacteria bacterium]